MSGPFGLPMPMLTDSYKASHAGVFPEAQRTVAYVEFRNAYEKDTEDTRMVFHGLQYVVEQYVARQWTMQDVEQAAVFFETHNAGHTAYPFPRELFERFVRENNGYFPVRIEALAEGSVVYPHTPVMQITAEGAYSGLVTYIETVLLMIWYPSTVATLSRRAWTVLAEQYAQTVDDDMQWTLSSRLHDFGFRGCTCVEQAMVGGAAHLLTFEGTDTMAAAYHAQFRLNGGRAVASSVPATEHSVMMAHQDERQAVLAMIEAYGDGAFACVMDTYDYARALEQVLPAVAERKLQRGGVLIIRPDSGDPVEAVLQGLHAAERVFGSTTNSKGFRVITGASVIQGDGVTLESLRRILAAVVRDGFSAQCVAFGMGGALLQKVNRDVMGIAYKLSSITDPDGSVRDVMKFPKGDLGKMSLPGRLAVHPDPAQSGVPVAYRCAPDADTGLLRVVYDCGPVADHRWDDFETVRRRLQHQWSTFPLRAEALSSELLEHQRAVHTRVQQTIQSGTAFGV
ncbi:hypothetical protein H4R20_001221 [Coemansia guatemalensis]|uniref:Nicotinamide phosphoribosyltransferase n=1 Tax=Coemansia guatemalensis TaxID=2761395 RepID=A0A9W8HXT7_9FUNG|nr:hypothetical protein H4R20_001221 [Coemansia guatemalensis]